MAGMNWDRVRRERSGTPATPQVHHGRADPVPDDVGKRPRKARTPPRDPDRNRQPPRARDRGKGITRVWVAPGTTRPGPPRDDADGSDD